MVTAECTESDCRLRAAVVATLRIARLERRTSVKVTHPCRVNHHGGWLLIRLALPVSNLDGRDVEQILAVCEILLVAALPKLAALWAAKQKQPQLGMLRNLGQPLANLWRLFDAPRNVLAV